MFSQSSIEVTFASFYWLFLLGFHTMTSPTTTQTSFEPAMAITQTGRRVPFVSLDRMFADLFRFGHMDDAEYDAATSWTNSYRYGGALPGCLLFRCIKTGRLVYYLTFLDGILDMYEACFRDSMTNIGRYSEIPNFPDYNSDPIDDESEQPLGEIDDNINYATFWDADDEYSIGSF
jgi:hypothetical protein